MDCFHVKILLMAIFSSKVLAGLVIRWAIHLNWWTNGVRLVLLEPEAFIRLHAFDKQLCIKTIFNKSVNNASLTPTQGGPSYDQARFSPICIWFNLRTLFQSWRFYTVHAPTLTDGPSYDQPQSRL